jgi:diguanylate cyclase (GGDEF)-like protein/putative nucleotidyltransferase with HDIG domain
LGLANQAQPTVRSMKWRDASLSTKSYLGGVCVIAIPVAISVFSSIPRIYGPFWIFLTLASFAVAFVNLSLPQIPSIIISMGDVFTFFVLVQFGPGPALITYWANVVGTSIARHAKRDGFRFFKGLSIHRLFFNISCCSISIFAMSTVLTIARQRFGEEYIVPIYSAVALTWFLANTGTLSIAVSLSSRKRILSVWREGLSLYLLNFFCSAAAAGLLSTLYKDPKNTTLWRFGPSVLLLLPIVVGVYQLYSFYVQKFQATQKHISDLNKLYLQTVETLASAVDAKDRYTHGHIRRVQVFATELAQCVGITGEDELMGMRAGALLHDIGKIAIPEYILNKPAALTESEFDKMKLHPGVGANMLKNIEFPFPVLPMVRSHHERWDGNGYPDRLKGEQIPIGARILSLVDCYDALTTNRPYRSPMKREEVISFFQREAGKSYDPSLVMAFITNLPRLEKAGQEVLIDNDIWGIREDIGKDTPILRPLEKVQPIQTYRKALGGDAQFQRDLYAVFEFARADIQFLEIKDVLSFIGNKLSELIPFDAGAFYTADLQNGVLVAEHVVGSDCGPLQNLTLPLEQKLSGWVAANNSSLFNLNPFPDFINMSGDKPPFQMSIIAPMNRGGVVSGAISLYRNGNSKFSDDECRRLELVASQTALAISKCNVKEDRGLVDKQTGLPNGYQLYLMFDQVATDAERYEYSIALLAIRTDDSKFRRKWGHTIGDEAVRTIAEYLKKELRETDLLVRYASDEFIILVPRVDLEGAEGLKSRFQDDLDHIKFPVRPGSQVSLPISIGISMFSTDGSNLESLISTAEWRMREDAELRAAVRRGIQNIPSNP